MVENPPPGYPRISPYLLYEDATAALAWLTTAFGFTERMHLTGADGSVAHAEIEMSGGVIMLGHPGADYQGPRRHGKICQLTSVYVDDVDAHFEHSKAAGAKILTEPKDEFYGDRCYRAEDPEGHQWNFAQHIKDVSPQEMQQSSDG